MLLGANIKKPRQDHRLILEAMTHLKMNKMKLSSLIQLDIQGNPKPLLAEHCPNLQILYLDENYLTSVGSMAFHNLKYLRQINLPLNMIFRMDCFD